MDTEAWQYQLNMKSTPPYTASVQPTAHLLELWYRPDTNKRTIYHTPCMHCARDAYIGVLTIDEQLLTVVTVTRYII